MSCSLIHKQQSFYADVVLVLGYKLIRYEIESRMPSVCLSGENYRTYATLLRKASHNWPRHQTLQFWGGGGEELCGHANRSLPPVDSMNCPLYYAVARP